MCAYKNRFVCLYGSDGFDLERVKCEGIFFGLEIALIRFSWKVFGEVDLVNAALVCADGFNFDLL
jgi:hypothetical protein